MWKVLVCMLLFFNPSVVYSQGLMPSVEHMAAQMLIVGFEGLEMEESSSIASAIKQGKVGGLILFSGFVVDKSARNILNPEQLKKLLKQINSFAPYPLFISIDQEGGYVQRLSEKTGFKNWLSAHETGQQSDAATYANALEMGSVLAELGFNINFAPVVDLDYANSLAIGDIDRAFHAEPQIVIAHAFAFIEAMEDVGIIPVIKHFPGHGSAAGDSHNGFTDISDTWEPKELAPYEAIIDTGYNGMIMVAHVYHENFDTVPASLSYNVNTKLLREELGWNGVIVSDDMQMRAITDHYSLEESLYKGIQAGVDIFIYGNNSIRYDEDISHKAHATIVKLVEDGRISKERLYESYLRIQKLRQDFNVN